MRSQSLRQNPVRPFGACCVADDVWIRRRQLLPAALRPALLPSSLTLSAACDQLSASAAANSCCRIALTIPPLQLFLRLARGGLVIVLSLPAHGIFSLLDGPYGTPMLNDQILIGARTVIQLDVHFGELKAAATELLGSDSARARGYFTPPEEEEYQHLLVSYWHSRNALLDLVLSLREETQISDQAFLVGFAGALLLVDAARFLRETFEGLPVVRKKLNEPIPSFGVPEDVYDTVQQSLTSPVNAWRLYHAAEYFEQQAGRLRQLADDELLRDVWDLIDRLKERVRVSLTRFIPAHIRVRTRQGIDGLTQDGLGRVMYRLQRLMSTLASTISVRPSHRPLLPAEVMGQIQACIQPGDIFLTRKEYALTNYFLPGYWPHAALYIGDAGVLKQRGLAEHPHLQPRWERLQSLGNQQPGRVLEALKDGVWIRTLDSPLSSDSVVVLRPRLAEEHIDTALGRGCRHDGKPYDFNFDFTRSDRLVCTEVVYRSYEGIDGIHFPLTRRAGRMTLASGDLLAMAQQRQHLEIIAAYVPDGSGRLTRDAEAEASVARWQQRG